MSSMDSVQTCPSPGVPAEFRRHGARRVRPLVAIIIALDAQGPVAHNQAS